MATTLKDKPFARVVKTTGPMTGPQPGRPKAKSKAIWEWKIVRRAIWDSLLKLNPRHMMGNPVMFVVEVGAVITTILLFKGGTQFGFNLQITLWLWFTVLFANFAEAMAEGRGKAQADIAAQGAFGNHGQSPAAGRTRRKPSPAPSSAPAMWWSWLPANSFPATARLSKASLRSTNPPSPANRRPVIREVGRRPLGRDRRHARALRPDQGPHHLQSGRDFPGPHDRAGGRRRAPEDAQRNRAEHPAGRPDHHLPAGRRHACSRLRFTAGAPQTVFVLVSLLVCLIPTTIGGPAFRHRHRGHGPPDPAQCARHVRPRRGSCRRREHVLLDKTGTITLGNRQATEFIPAPGVTEARTGQTPPNSPRLPTKLRKAAPSWCWRRRSTDCAGGNWPNTKPNSCPSPRRPACRGVNLNGFEIRKGAADAITHIC